MRRNDQTHSQRNLGSWALGASRGRAVISSTASSVGARPVGGAIARELAASKDEGDGDGDAGGLNRAQRRKAEAQKRKGEKGKRPSAR